MKVIAVRKELADHLTSVEFETMFPEPPWILHNSEIYKFNRTPYDRTFWEASFDCGEKNLKNEVFDASN